MAQRSTEGARYGQAERRLTAGGEADSERFLAKERTVGSTVTSAIHAALLLEDSPVPRSSDLFAITLP
jgi:hypothetical protein